LKRDRLDGNDSAISTSRGIQLGIEDPKGSQITPQQRTWIRNWLNQFESVLYGANYRDPVNGYIRFMDPATFIDAHWLVELARNIDGYRLSWFMYKDRNDKLKMGPAWDYNLTFGNADYLDGWRTNGWYWPSVGDADYPWYRRIFSDPDFNQAYIDRWAELRKEVLKTDRVLARVDELAAYLGEAQVRNYNKWRILGVDVWPNWYVGKTYADEINWMKGWIRGRFDWIDKQYTNAPVFSHVSGPIEPGFTFTMSAHPNTVVYYTLDGSDPRARGGSVAAGANTYSGPITLNSSARVFARANRGAVWSAPTIASFYTSIPRLVITEIMFHPAPPPLNSPFTRSDFEFIELKNAGATTLNLAGFRFSNGIEFNFAGSSVTSLAPGEYVLVVKNRAAFVSRYGELANIAGEFIGSLENAGERIALAGPLGEPIHDFAYNDRWYPATEGFGFSLVIADENAPLDAWANAANWRLNATLGGTPGALNPINTVPAIWINEILTHTDPPLVDAIELFNPNAFDVNIGSWLLTDDRAEPGKYRIPAGKTIRAQSYLVFDETDFNVNPGQDPSFTLSSHGEEVYLFSADANGNLTGFIDGFSFEAAANAVTFGRHVLSTGEVEYPPQISRTLGAPNAGIFVGPVVINEIHYRSSTSRPEFIELKNISDSPIKLFDPLRPTNRWTINGLGFEFPAGTELPPQGFIVLTGNDPAAFRTQFNVPAEVQVLGPYPGFLQDDGERVQLQRPDAPDIEPDGTVIIPWITVDEVRYNDRSPWPTNAIAAGTSLERINAQAYGNDPANWAATDQVMTPGRENAALTRPIVEGVELFQGNLRLRFTAEAGRAYTIQVRDNLSGSSWTDLATYEPAPNSRSITHLDPITGGRSTRFYRIVTR
ncbi:MAG: lamin tail domain-containing protein, partial [Verrucomicrobiota bacterium]